MHKFDPRKRAILDDPKRFFFENPDAILSEAGVKSGQAVADIGCGTGFFTPAAFIHGLWPWMNAPAFGRDVAPLGREVGCHGLYPWGSTLPLARHVGENGKVFALDTSHTMIKELRERTKNLKQVKPIPSQENKFPLGNESVDFVLLVNRVHELEDWNLFFKEVKRVLTPGGRVRLRSGQAARGMPFDKLNAPSTAEGLRVDTEQRFLPRSKNRGLAPSNVSNCHCEQSEAIPRQSEIATPYGLAMTTSCNSKGKLFHALSNKFILESGEPRSVLPFGERTGWIVSAVSGYTPLVNYPAAELRGIKIQNLFPCCHSCGSRNPGFPVKTGTHFF